MSTTSGLRVCSTAAVGLLAVAGCTSATTREAVHPTENATAEEHGELASQYHLQQNEAQIGDVKVWSHGAYKAEIGGQRQTVIRVGFQVQNSSDQPIIFNPQMTKLSSVKVDKGELTNLPIATTQGRFIIPAHSQGEVDAYFIMPDGLEPQQVDGFDLMWSVNSGGRQFSEFTNFQQDEYYFGYATPSYPFYGPYPYAYDPFYEPLYYDPWYWSYYRPVVVTQQSPGVVTGARENPRVREHGQMSRAATPTPPPKPLPGEQGRPPSPAQKPFQTPTPTNRPSNVPPPSQPSPSRSY